VIAENKNYRLLFVERISTTECTLNPPPMEMLYSNGTAKSYLSLLYAAKHIIGSNAQFGNPLMI
jgi:hypothetical protein